MSDNLPRRMWINAPSTHQPQHCWHGERVLAMPEPTDPQVMRVYFTDGETVSCRMPAQALSEGWPSRTYRKLTHEELQQKLDKDPNQVGDKFKHHSGEAFTLVGRAFDCKTNELMAVYKPTWGTVMFTRPMNDFKPPKFN